MPSFRKRPVIVEAMQVPDINQYAGYFLAWADIVGLDTDIDPGRPVRGSERGCYFIQTPEGLRTASPGDWIIQDVKGELYSCKPDIFEQTYEPVEK